MIDYSPQFTRIGDMIRSRAQQLSAKPAFRFYHRTTSYAELDRHSNRVANGLAAAGLGHGDRVLYLGRNSDRYFELYMASAKLGAVITPINWRLAAPELAAVVADSGGKILFAEEDLFPVARKLEPFASNPANLHVFSHEQEDAFCVWRDRFPDDDLNWPVEPDDPVIQLYTSGTTGVPKGVVGSHRSMLVFRSMRPDAQPDWNKWAPDDVSLLVQPQFHIAGSGHGLQTLCAGATGFVMREFDVDRIMQLIATERLSRVYVVPAILQRMLHHPRLHETDYSHLRTITYGASPIAPSVLEDAIDIFKCDFVQQYGMTEILGTITVLGPEDHRSPDRSLLRSAGRALRGVEMAILDANGDHLPRGEMGEIATRTPTLMIGYWKKPAETAAALTPDGFYRTGDAGYLDANGYLFIKDRIKDMIVSGGENVYPAEVEAVLGAHPLVIDVAVIGVPDPKWGEAVKAIVVIKPGEELDADELTRWSREQIAGYKLPKSIDFRSELPRNSSGKILRRALRDEFWGAGERLVR